MHTVNTAVHTAAVEAARRDANPAGTAPAPSVRSYFVGETAAAVRPPVRPSVRRRSREQRKVEINRTPPWSLARRRQRQRRHRSRS